MFSTDFVKIEIKNWRRFKKSDQPKTLDLVCAVLAYNADLVHVSIDNVCKDWSINTCTRAAL